MRNVRRIAATRVEEWLVLTKRFAESEFPTILQSLGGAILAIVADWGVWRWLGVAIFGAGLCSFIAQRWKSRSRLDYRYLAERRGRDLIQVFEHLLSSALNELDLNRDTVRASVYAHTDKAFVLLARISRNITLCQVGRPSYPEDAGVIGEAWRVGEANTSGLPEKRDDWEQETASKYGIPARDVKHLKMQARSLIGLRLASAAHGDACGVLVLEDERPRGLRGPQLDRVKAQPSSVRLLTTLLDRVVDGLDANELVSLQEAKRREPKQAAAVAE